MLGVIRQLFESHLRILSTIWFNFRYLPFKQAYRLPIFIFGKVYWRGIKKGNIVFRCELKPGIVRIGYVNVPWHSTTNKTSYHILGRHIIHGPVSFGEGCQIIVKREGLLETGNCTWFHRNVRIICYKHITIDDGSCVTWEDQLIDTNFHYMVKDGIIHNNLSDDVYIGKNVWIGNRVSVMRGAYIPSKSIIASNSLVNKDFSSSSEEVLIAGSPAQIVRCNIKRAQYEGRDNCGSIFIADSDIKRFFDITNISEIDIENKEFNEYLKSTIV